MKKKISKYISLLLILNSILMCPTSGAAQSRKGREKAKTAVETPVFQGIRTSVDIAGLGSYILGGDILDTGIAIQANLKNKFMPVVEIGFGKTDTRNDDNDMHYKTQAPYFRIGLDYNAFHSKTHLPGFIYAGVRYGFSSFKYDVDGPDMKDTNYGGNVTVPYSYSGIKSNSQWMEAVAGLSVKVYKGFSMGWDVRFKKSLSIKEEEKSRPWYIPGYGKNASTCFTIHYNLIYKLPF